MDTDPGHLLKVVFKFSSINLFPIIYLYPKKSLQGKSDKSNHLSSFTMFSKGCYDYASLEDVFYVNHSLHCN